MSTIKNVLKLWNRAPSRAATLEAARALTHSTSQGGLDETSGSPRSAGTMPTDSPTASFVHYTKLQKFVRIGSYDTFNLAMDEIECDPRHRGRDLVAPTMNAWRALREDKCTFAEYHELRQKALAEFQARAEQTGVAYEDAFPTNEFR